nr:ATP-binding cassette domain-containing protein [Xanthomonas euvesicatoria]
MRGNAWPSALSGGQRRPVALARALVHRPRLLLLDEPLGALDASSRIVMQQLIVMQQQIVRLWRQHGFALVLVTHDVAEASALADRIVVLDHGKGGLGVAGPCRIRVRPGCRRWRRSRHRCCRVCLARHRCRSQLPRRRRCAMVRPARRRHRTPRRCNASSSPASSPARVGLGSRDHTGACAPLH